MFCRSSPQPCANRLTPDILTTRKSPCGDENSNCLSKKLWLASCFFLCRKQVATNLVPEACCRLIQRFWRSSPVGVANGPGWQVTRSASKMVELYMKRTPSDGNCLCIH